MSATKNSQSFIRTVLIMSNFPSCHVIQFYEYTGQGSFFSLCSPGSDLQENTCYLLTGYKSDNLMEIIAINLSSQDVAPLHQINRNGFHFWGGKLIHQRLTHNVKVEKTYVSSIYGWLISSVKWDYLHFNGMCFAQFTMRFIANCNLRNPVWTCEEYWVIQE